MNSQGNSDSSNNEDDYHIFMNLQINEMNRYKWIESERVGYDLKNTALIDWINKYAERFRKEYEEQKERIKNQK